MSELCSVPRVSERFAQSNALDEDIARLKYVSGEREEALRRLGIRTVGAPPSPYPSSISRLYALLVH